MTARAIVISRPILLLFDVDGTLLQAGFQEHNLALKAAVRDICGRYPDTNLIPLAGRTDTEILLDMAKCVGVNADADHLRRMFAAASAEFDRSCSDDVRNLVIPGVRPALDRFRQAGATMGLLTGNIEPIAWRKRTAAGLREFFSFGAFGDESGYRPDLAPLAAGRAGSPVHPRDSYVIGDTPLDIDCGRSCEMHTVAVGTGRYSVAELRAWNPSFVCESLEEFAGWLLG